MQKRLPYPKGYGSRFSQKHLPVHCAKGEVTGGPYRKFHSEIFLFVRCAKGEAAGGLVPSFFHSLLPGTLPAVGYSFGFSFSMGLKSVKNSQQAKIVRNSPTAITTT